MFVNGASLLCSPGRAAGFWVLAAVCSAPFQLETFPYSCYFCVVLSSHALAARVFCPHRVLMQGEGLIPIASTTWVCKVIGKGLLRQNTRPPVLSCSPVPLGDGNGVTGGFLRGSSLAMCGAWRMRLVMCRGALIVEAELSTAATKALGARCPSSAPRLTEESSPS